MKLLRLLIIPLVALSLGGCGTVRDIGDKVGAVYTAATTSKLSRDDVVLARTVFNGLEITATKYLRLRRCTGTNGPLCRDPAWTPTIIASVKSGRAARNDLTAFMRTHPDMLGAEGLYDALKASTDTLNRALAVYKANS